MAILLRYDHRLPGVSRVPRLGRGAGGPRARAYPRGRRPSPPRRGGSWAWLALLALVLVAIPAGAWALSLGSGKVSRVTPSHAPAGTSGLVITMKMGGSGLFGSGGPPPPPAGIPPKLVTLGTVAARHVTHPTQDTIVAVFDFAPTEVPGNKAAAIVFATPQGSISYTRDNAFRVDAPLPGMPVLTVEPQPLARCEGGRRPSPWPPPATRR